LPFIFSDSVASLKEPPPRFTVHLPSLEKLILTGNCIASIDDVDIHGLPKLQSLALINNEGVRHSFETLIRLAFRLLGFL
jgi:hypothetical protein